MIYTGCKTEGCTYPEAINYNADAEKDDGSCMFSEENSSAAAAWVGNYVVNQTSQLPGGQPQEESYSISITEITTDRVLIQNLINCGDMEANVTETSMVIVEFEEICSWQHMITQTNEGFNFTAERDQFGMAADVVGSAVLQ